MRKSFAKIPAPILAGVIKEKTPENAIAAIRNCEYKGATGIDLHLSCLDDEYHNTDCIKKIIDATRLPVLALNYNLSYDGSFYESTEEKRISLLLTAIEAGAAAADMQGYTFDLQSKNSFRQEYASLGYKIISACEMFAHIIPRNGCGHCPHKS